MFWVVGGAAVLVLLLLFGIGSLTFVWMNRPLTDGTEITQKDRPNYDATLDRLPPAENKSPTAGDADQKPSDPVRSKSAKPQRQGGVLPPLNGTAGPPDNKKKPGKGGRIGIDQFQVQFLTSVAKGRRFAIIADRSGSMRGGGQRRAIDLLHDELIRTIKSLKSGSSYYISFFGSNATPMPFGDTWVAGGKDVEKVAAWVRTVQPSGGTQPLPAFQKVFKLDPRPDVIFFMTDGSFSPTVASSVDRLNDAKKKVVINTIQFQLFAGTAGYERYKRLLRHYEFSPDVKRRLQGFAGRTGGGSRLHLNEIAKRSGGTFTFFGPNAKKMTSATTVKKPAKTKAPILGRLGQISAADKEYLYRRGCRYKVHKLSLKAGVTYQIDMVANFDTYLFLTDAKGKILARDDDGGAGRNSLITYTPPRDGTFRVIATTCGRRRFGPYVVTVIDGVL